MRIRFVFVGKNDEGEYARGIERYVKRISRFVPAEVVVVREERPGSRPDPARIMREEGRRIAANLDPKDFTVVCDPAGKEPTSEELARDLRRWLDSSPRAVVLVVGGAFGLDGELKARARAMLSVSRLTLPHQLARLVLAEQVYRAVATLSGVAYSK